MAETPTVLELFERFLPNYRHVELIPHDLCLGRHWSEVASTFNYLYLKVGRNGEPLKENLWPLLDLKMAGVTFNFGFGEAGGPFSLWTGLNATIGKAVKEQVLKDRRFALAAEDPAALFDTSRATNLTLKVEGEPIPGLCETTWRICGSWDLLVPRDSPEGQAIEARLMLGFRKSQLSKAGDPKAGVEAAEAEFARRMQRLAA